MKQYRVRDLADLVDLTTDPDDWVGKCHEISLRLVRTGVFGESASVARGWCTGVRSQHSWVTTGNPYDTSVTIIDPTLWTYRSDVNDIWYGTLADAPIHVPHGAGSIWEWGRPPEPEGEVIPIPDEAWSKAGIKGRERLSLEAFLSALGPLDERGWRMLAHAPVEHWPAAQLYRLAEHVPGLYMRVWVPIDQWAMVTGENVQELYR